MDAYEKLLEAAHKYGCIVKELPLNAFDGLTYDNKIGIRESIQTHAQKADVLAEEIGHVLFTVGNILDQTDERNRKQELTARKWAYDKRIGLDRLVDALVHGCRSAYEASEYLGVSEEFLEEAIGYYRSRYGVCVDVDNYTLILEPSLNIIRR